MKLSKYSARNTKKVFAIICALALFCGNSFSGIQPIVKASEGTDNWKSSQSLTEVAAEFQAGLEFGDTDTYLQLSEPITSIPQTIEVSVKDMATEWTIKNVDAMNAEAYGVTTQEDVADGPEDGTKYAEYNDSHTGYILNKDLNEDYTGAFNFGTYQKENLALTFWYWTEQDGTLPGEQLELGSHDTQFDISEIYWNMQDISVRAGWNRIVLPLEEGLEADAENEFVVERLVRMRWYSVEEPIKHTFRITDLKIVPYEKEEYWTIAKAADFANAMGTEVSEREANGPDATWNVVEIQNVTDKFDEIFETPLLEGYTSKDVMLAFWYCSFESEATVLPSGQIEISSTYDDSGEIHWQTEHIVVESGWNYIELPFSCYENEGNEETTFDLDTIKYIRWYGMNGKSCKLSDMRLVIQEAPKSGWTIYDPASTITNGYGSKKVTIPTTAVILWENTFSLGSELQYYEKEDLALSFWYYSYQDGTMPGGQIEITSSGGPDVNELGYPTGSISVHTGWNYIQIPFNEMGITGGDIELNNINYMRWYSDATRSEEWNFSISKMQIVEVGTHQVSIIENVVGASLDGSMIFSNTNNENEDSTYALFVTREGYPALVCGTTQYTLNYVLSTDEWTDLAVVHVSDTIRFYIDGIFMGSAAAKEWVTGKFCTPHCIGADGGGNNLTEGYIADVRLWDDVRSSSEIRLGRVAKENSTEHGLTDTTGLIGSWYLYGNIQYILETMPDAVNNGNPAVFQGSRVDDWYKYDISEHDFLWEDLNKNSIYDTGEENYWSVVYIPSAQYITEDGDAEANIWNHMWTWISENQDAEKIQFVIGPEGNMEESKEANTYHRYTVGKTSWMVLQMQATTTLSTIQWANNLLEQYPNDNVILIADGYAEDEIGEAIWDGVKEHSNIKMVLCGCGGSNTGAITVKEETNAVGRTVKVLMMSSSEEHTSYYSGRPLGMLSLLRFSEDAQQVAVDYYSPWDDRSFNPVDLYDTENRNTKNITMEYGVQPYIVAYQNGAEPGKLPDETTIPQGYVFAGWYTNEACTKVLKSTTEDTAYAKFVSEEVLGVNAQVYLDKLVTKVGGNTEIRFITSVDSLKYQEVGFNITINGVTKTIESDTVCQKLYAIGEHGLAGAAYQTYTPYEQFTLSSNYFNTYILYDIPYSHYGTKIQVTAYWITQDGTIVQGETVNKTIYQGLPYPKIAETVYETKDVLVGDYFPVEMGYAVDPTGQTDSTEGIQEALNDCSAAGGGVVFLPVGKYLISDSIYIPPFVTLHGDWQDPDDENFDGKYGTIIIADVASEDAVDTGTFKIGGSAGVVGLTIYYPEQSIDNVQPYPYTFYIAGSTVNEYDYMLSTICNTTVINGYRGIGAATYAEGNNATHEQLKIQNFKGTFLKYGIYETNSGEVGSIKQCTISNKYWKEASDNCMVAVSDSKIDAYTKANTTGIAVGGLEFHNFNDLLLEDCAIGMNVVASRRTYFSGSMYDISIKNCTQGIVIDKMNPEFGSVIARGEIEGGITNTDTENSNEVSKWKICDVEMLGDITEAKEGTILIDNEIDLSENTINYQKRYVKPASNLLVARLSKGSKDVAELSDVAAELQKVIDQAASEGGGIVYVPAGIYRFDNPITIPASVELRGSSAVAQRDQRGSSNGTVFLCCYGDGSEYGPNDTAFITLEGENAGINGIRIIYPLNGPKDDDISTTYTVRGKASGVYILNSTIAASAYGVDFRNCDNHYIEGVMMTCYQNGFYLGGQGGILTESLLNGSIMVRITEVWGLTNWIAESESVDSLINPILRKECQFIQVEDAENQLIYNTFAYGAHTFVTNTASQNTCLYNVGTDNLADDGNQISLKSGSLKGVNILRYNGNSYEIESGALELYNRMAIDDTTETTIKVTQP